MQSHKWHIFPDIHTNSYCNFIKSYSLSNQMGGEFFLILNYVTLIKNEVCVLQKISLIRKHIHVSIEALLKVKNV